MATGMRNRKGNGCRNVPAQLNVTAATPALALHEVSGDLLLVFGLPDARGQAELDGQSGNYRAVEYGGFVWAAPWRGAKKRRRHISGHFSQPSNLIK